MKYRVWRLVFDDLDQNMNLEIPLCEYTEFSDVIWHIVYNPRKNMANCNSIPKIVNYDGGDMQVLIFYKERYIIFKGYANSHILTLIVRGDLISELIQYEFSAPVLHASGIAKDNNSYAFIGDTCSGKSTIAMYCAYRKKYKLIADDVFPLFYNGKVDDCQTVSLLAGTKLREESCAFFNSLNGAYMFTPNEYFHNFDMKKNEYLNVKKIFWIKPFDGKPCIRQIFGANKYLACIQNRHQRSRNWSNAVSENFFRSISKIQIYDMFLPHRYQELHTVYDIIDAEIKGDS